MTHQRSAIVVGAGFGGLGAALRLKALGYDVLLLEKNVHLGGKAQVIRQDGHTWDVGPTVITAPFLLEELFGLFGKRLDDAVELTRLDPWYRFMARDGQFLDYGEDPGQLLHDIAALSPEDADGYRRFAALSERIYDIGFSRMADQPFGSVRDLLPFAGDMLRLKAYLSVYGLAKSCFKHPLLRRAFSLQPLLVGGNPLSTTAIYALIHWLERLHGVHYAVGGMGEVAKALGNLLMEEGGEVRTGVRVEEILFSGTAATGVRLADGGIERADVVVVNGDPAFVYRHLIPKELRRFWNNGRLNRMSHSIGTYLLCLGLDKQYEGVPHHTIVLGEKYRRTLKDIFGRKVLPQDPSLYVHRPTATDASVAPAGCDTLYALAPVPNLAAGVDWTVGGEQEAAFRETVYAMLDETLLPGVRQRVRAEKVLTPARFAARDDAHLGASFSIAPSFAQSACFRFGNKAEDFDGLYFVGAGTHPGAGVPGVLSSAKVMENLLKREGRA